MPLASEIALGFSPTPPGAPGDLRRPRTQKNDVNKKTAAFLFFSDPTFDAVTVRPSGYVQPEEQCTTQRNHTWCVPVDTCSPKGSARPRGITPSASQWIRAVRRAMHDPEESHLVRPGRYMQPEGQ